jgi:hypothetical protein
MKKDRSQDGMKGVPVTTSSLLEEMIANSSSGGGRDLRTQLSNLLSARTNKRI